VPSPKKKKPSSPTVAQVKKRIQALLRERAIKRDGGCILRHYTDAAGRCGKKLVLQAEHLNGRSHANSFAEMDNIVCLCSAHHLFFKKREPFLYQILVRAHIGEKRWAKIEAWTQDRSEHRKTKKEWLAIEESLKTQ